MPTKTKNILLLLGALIVLMVILLTWQNPFTQKDNSNEEKIYTANLEGVKKIEIIQQAKTTTLNKSDFNWIVASEENAIANQTLIDNLIETLKNAQIGIAVSQNPDKLATFNLNDELATKLKVYTDQESPAIDLLIGKNSLSGLNQTYIRKAGENKTILVNADLVSAINQTDWKQPEPVIMTTPTPAPTE